MQALIFGLMAPVVPILVRKLYKKEENLTALQAVGRYMVYALGKSLEHCNLTVEDIKYIATHQANMRIVAQVAHQLGLPMERFLNNIRELGNTGSASSALVLAQNRDKFAAGDRAALVVFGGGYSCGSMILEF